MSTRRYQCIPSMGMILCCLCVAQQGWAGILRVDEKATGRNDGTSWSDAFTSLSRALRTARSGDQVWIAEGRYTPDTSGLDDPHKATFEVFYGMSIYGGFPSGGGKMTDRDPNVHVTTLSGDLNRDDPPGDQFSSTSKTRNRSDNCYGVVWCFTESGGILLDGLTIESGHANNPDEGWGDGGGLYVDGGAVKLSRCKFRANYARDGGAVYGWCDRITIDHCQFSHNVAESCGGGIRLDEASLEMTVSQVAGNDAGWGGGLAVFNSDDVRISSTDFFSNTATSDGGGMYNGFCNPIIAQCTFSANCAGSTGGGMSNLENGNPLLIGCVFTNRNMAAYGGGMSNMVSSCSAVNCRFYSNEATYGGGIYVRDECDVKLTNCVFSGNSAKTGGGALTNYHESTMSLINCTLYDNRVLAYASDTDESADLDEVVPTSATGAIANSASCTTILTNCIAWGNGPVAFERDHASIDHSCIEGDVPEGPGNIADPPRFVDPDGLDNKLGTEDDNLRLCTASPCLDAGDNVAFRNAVAPLEPLAGVLDRDPDGSSRFTTATTKGSPSIIDMGAYEGARRCYALEVSTSDIHIAEGAQATFTVRLTEKPDSPVQVKVHWQRGDADIRIISGATLTFGPDNYAKPQEVRLAAAEDGDCLNGQAIVGVTVEGVMSIGVRALEQDNDPAPHLYFVDSRAPGANDGRSWQNAFRDLQTALEVVRMTPREGQLKILVARGVYRPAEARSCDRSTAFLLCSGVGVYGGYAGWGAPDPNARDAAAYETVLSGDINGDDASQHSSDNVYSVVIAVSAEPGTVLDGFTISGGNAVNRGGGIRISGGSPKISHCTFTGNKAFKGAGISCEGGSPTISDCAFRVNKASWGGAIALKGSAATILNCTFISNDAKYGGGAVHCKQGAEPLVTNCRIIGNWAGYGGALFTDDCRVAVVHCTLQDNLAEAYYGNAFACWAFEGDKPSELAIDNCIIADGGDELWNYDGSLVSVASTHIQGYWPSQEGFQRDICLTPDGHLQLASSCRDAGRPSQIAIPTELRDVDGEDRTSDPNIDPGADEYVDDDEDGLPNWWEEKHFGPSRNADPAEDSDYDGIANIDEYELFSSNPTAKPHFVDGGKGSDDYDGSTPLFQGGKIGPKRTIQAGINAARDGDTVLVAKGTYAGSGNIDLDFGGRLIVLAAFDPGAPIRSLAGPGTVTIDCQGQGRGFNFHSGETSAAAIVGFAIHNGFAATEGGAIRCKRSHPQIIDCGITGSASETDGSGGLYCYRSVLTIGGSLELDACKFAGEDMMLAGPGTLTLATDVIVDLEDTVIRSDVAGTGKLNVGADAILIVEGVADVNLAGPTKGTISCAGLLHLRDEARLQNATIEVVRAQFAGQAIVSNNVIKAETAGPYGQFYIEGTVEVKNNDIHADGDRYMDLDPSVFAGMIENNRIYITISEGQGNTRGGLLELRGWDYYSSRHAPGQFLCRLSKVPEFDTTTWTVERLELLPGAKVNLTNRFDFNGGGASEVMYVKKLVLGEGSVLNTASNRLYYQELEGDRSGVIDVPLLGFSLGTIAFDHPDDFDARVKHNNGPESDPRGQKYVDRDVLPDDPNDGVMVMRNLTYKIDSNDQTEQAILVQARAKGHFGKSNEDEILIRFEYQFQSRSGELVVYLSDTPELSDPNDSQHYLHVGSVPAPPDGRPGSVGSGQFGVFHKFIPKGHLNFAQGTRIEFKLVGPEGTCVWINNWDPDGAPKPRSSCCGDFAGKLNEVSAVDFLAVIGACGRRAADVNTPSAALSGDYIDHRCSEDGYITVHDAIFSSWFVHGHACFSDDRLGSIDWSSDAYHLHASNGAPQASQAFSVAGAGAGNESTFRVAGKIYDPVDLDFRSDCYCDLDENGLLGRILRRFPPGQVRGKLVRDRVNGDLYQLDIDEGLVGLSDDLPIVSPGIYSCNGTPVSIGIQQRDGRYAGLPVLDAAFDASGNLYVVPVVVKADRLYVAAAKLEPQGTGYELAQVYYEPLADNDNFDPNGLCELDVDAAGNVYVLNVKASNYSDKLSVFRPDGTPLAGLFLADPRKNPCIPAPIGLHVSDATGLVYLASSLAEPAATSSILYGISQQDILSGASQPRVSSWTIDKVGHITDVTTAPGAKAVWIVGFTMQPPSIVNDSLLDGDAFPFYMPYCASFSRDNPVVWSKSLAVYEYPNPTLALPLSILWTGNSPGLGTSASVTTVRQE